MDSKADFVHLHNVIQIAMGWTDSHLHHFMVGNRNKGPVEFIGQTYDDFDMGMDYDHDSKKSKIDGFLKQTGDKLMYEYDFGDSWGHTVLLEKILEEDPSVTYPTCIKGVRACPPEDCGGIWGYEELVEVLQNPKHPDYEEMKEWVDKDFDPISFDLEATNNQLKTLARKKNKK